MSDKRFRVPLPICGAECLCCTVIPERAIDAAAHSNVGRRRGATRRGRRARPGGPGASACDADEAKP